VATVCSTHPLPSTDVSVFEAEHPVSCRPRPPLPPTLPPCPSLVPLPRPDRTSSASVSSRSAVAADSPALRRSGGRSLLQHGQLRLSLGRSLPTSTSATGSPRYRRPRKSGRPREPTTERLSRTASMSATSPWTLRRTVRSSSPSQSARAVARSRARDGLVLPTAAVDVH
jgi:hypothetical protein